MMMRPESSTEMATPSRATPSKTQPPVDSVMPYVVTAEMPASRARLTSASGVAAPPMSTVCRAASQPVAALSSRMAASCEGTNDVANGLSV